MEVILLDDVAHVGHEGDIATVADGYARNYLIPKRMAMKATRGAHKELEQRRRAIEARQQHKRDTAGELAERLKEKTILIQASVGEGGRLHGEVTPQNIADVIAEQLGVEITRRDIDIPVPIRDTGDYLISAILYKDVTVQLAIRVIGAGDEEQPRQPDEDTTEDTEETTPVEPEEMTSEDDS